MNEVQRNYLNAKQALREAWGAIRGEGTAAQWKAWGDAMRHLDQCEDELIVWGSGVAARITTEHENRANIAHMFNRATNGHDLIRRRVIEMSLRITA